MVPMSAAALLDRLGRPGDIRLGSTRPERVARLSTGLAVLDEALGGGLPRGRVSELAGPPSTGRTGLACAIVAAATRAGETIAWVDPADALEPEAAAAAGIALARLLWVRPRSVSDAFRAAEILLGAGGFGLVVLDVDARRARPRAGRAARALERRAGAPRAARGDRRARHRGAQPGRPARAGAGREAGLCLRRNHAAHRLPPRPRSPRRRRLPRRPRSCRAAARAERGGRPPCADRRRRGGSARARRARRPHRRAGARHRGRPGRPPARRGRRALRGAGPGRRR